MTLTDTQIFEPDGRAIPFAEEGNGPAVVLIPERGQEVGSPGGLAHSVSMEDFRVIRIGVRASADPAGSLSELAQDVVDVMDHLGVDHAWVGGHATGGSIARTVSVDHHHRVNGVILLGVEETETALAPSIPVLVIQGTADDITPPVNGERLQASAPDRVSVVGIEGAGHLFPSTHIGATSWAIEDYLDWD
ncbi:MAG: alpha/beta hydrolase [Microbacterium sp.]|uniref:alpha/beta fold hydrolase n=1 Tax=Microbacterium sp. TaxID=51671 RepID=UPI001AC73E91|nr:alpha/beta hydrolase [Microbacterium sp.]MBN9173621.1 alpha/beta hydrolase [Microbacterium sp.]